MNKKIWLIAALFAVSILQRVEAVPVVSTCAAVSLVTRGQFRAEGIGFGTKPFARPLIFADFANDSNPNPIGRITAWTEQQNLVRVSSCNGLSNTSFCMKGTWTAATDVDNPFGKLSHSFAIEANQAEADSVFHQLYDDGYRYYDFLATDSANTKQWRLFGLGSQHDFVQSTDSGGVALNECTNQPGHFLNGTVPRNQWNKEEHLWIHGSQTVCNADGSGNGRWKWTINGSVQQNVSNDCNCGDDHHQFRVWDNFADSAHFPGEGKSIWMAALYVDDNAARVGISNSATSAAATRMNAQPCTLWTSTAVAGCQLNLAGLDLSQNLYLYVRDSNEVWSVNGLILSTGVITNNPNPNTSLNPTQTASSTSSFTVIWSSVPAANYVVVVALDSAFTVIASSGVTSYPFVYNGAQCSTGYFFKVKVASESDASYALNIINPTTLACIGGSTQIPSGGRVRGFRSWRQLR